MVSTEVVELKVVNTDPSLALSDVKMLKTADGPGWKRHGLYGVSLPPATSNNISSIEAKRSYAVAVSECGQLGASISKVKNPVTRFERLNFWRGPRCQPRSCI